MATHSFRHFALVLSLLSPLVFPGCGTAPTPSPSIKAKVAQTETLGETEQTPPEPTAPAATEADTSAVASEPQEEHPARNPFRPPSVKVRTVTTQQAKTADIRLLGIAKRDSQQIALVLSAGELHRAIVGDFVDGWEVLEVTGSQATLRRGLEQISLQIR